MKWPTFGIRNGLIYRHKKYGLIGFFTVALLWYDRFRRHRSSKSSGNDNERKPRDYIYINLNTYKEFLSEIKEKEELEKKWVSNLTNPVEKWWKSAKHTFAWRLLRTAQSGSHNERLKAVRQLACVKSLKDWDFRHLAQICDARTAVSLARCKADSRWHLPRPKSSTDYRVMLQELHELLNSFRSNGCVDNFLKKKNKSIEELLKVERNASPSQDDYYFLKDVTILLLHITNQTLVAEELLNHGILTRLMELREIFYHDIEAQSTICKVLSNVSLVSNSVEHFFVSGWLGVLNQWQNSGDLRLKVIASKTLANLDHDDPHHVFYAANIYPLYPRRRTRIKPTADIIFIHGILGGVFITWRQKDNHPKELSLYGRNSFYTSQSDDVFIAGDIPVYDSKSSQIGQSDILASNNSQQRMVAASVLTKFKEFDVSGPSTKNILLEEDFLSDWEIVYQDVPLKANYGCTGEFSVPVSSWRPTEEIETYTKCWPMDWLPGDCPKLRVIGVDFMSAVTEWSDDSKFCPCEKNATKMETRASLLLNHIAKSDIGNNRPVVWISHSLGGILTKIMLMKSSESPDITINQIAKNTRGIAFLGTPHRGSPMAKWNNHMQLLLSPSVEVKEMEEGSPQLLTLHYKFVEDLYSKLKNVQILSIAEGVPTMLTSLKFPLTIVTEESALIDIGDFFVLKEDHLSLSKPALRESFLYQRLLMMIRESTKT